MKYLIVNPKTVKLLRRAGFRHPIRTIQESKRAGVKLSYTLAFLDKESYRGWNIYGQDFVKNPIRSHAPPPKALRVTRRNYATYKYYRQRGFGMQGVGPFQLTWYELQDKADAAGGCRKVRYNMRTGLEHFKALRRNHKTLFDAVKAYNGTGDKATGYARDWLLREEKWSKYLK